MSRKRERKSRRKMLSIKWPLATSSSVLNPRRQSRCVRDTVFVDQIDQVEKENGKFGIKSRRWTVAAMLTATTTMTTLLASLTPTSASAAPSSSSSFCTVDAGEGGKMRLSFFRGLLGSSPEAPCGIEEILESGRAGGEAFRERRSDEQKKRRRRDEDGVLSSSSSSSSSLDERAALEEEQERATQDFVESMWQGLE